MRKFLYLSLMERLKQLTDETGQPVIKTWNGGMPQQADVTLRLHIVSSWKGSAREGSEFRQQALERFDLLETMDSHLFNISGDDGKTSFSVFRRTGSSTNHNHEELVEDITDFTCKVIERK